jgi:hypothetical protein
MVPATQEVERQGLRSETGLGKSTKLYQKQTKSKRGWGWGSSEHLVQVPEFNPQYCKRKGRKEDREGGSKGGKGGREEREREKERKKYPVSRAK